MLNVTASSTSNLTIKFPENNNIGYWQSFNFFKGIPHAVNFNVTFISDRHIKLTAEGYGVFGNYGNGPLHLYMSQNDLEKFLK